MARNKKLFMIVACVAALVIGGAAATMAYFTDTDGATNTFTVGKVGISLDEAEVKTDGTYVTDKTNRVTENEYHLIPGHSYIKDPTVHVDADSEECWLYVTVENQIDDIETKEANKTVAGQMGSKGWTSIDRTINGQTVYAYDAVVKAGENVVVFDNFIIDGNSVTNDNLAPYKDKKIIVTAYAIQKDGFNTAVSAWDAVNGNF